MPPTHPTLPENQMRELLGVLGRRRAWWIVPLAGGVVVGVALVALVPRKYVVKTMVEILPTYAEELTSRGRETTIDKEIATVQSDLTAHSRVRKVLEEDVPTPEFAVLTDEEKDRKVGQVNAGINVLLVPKSRSGGDVVHGTYRDHDPYFAALFLNALFKRWREDVRGRLLRGILEELQRKNDKANDRKREYEASTHAVRDYLVQSDLPPELATGSLLTPPADPVYLRLEALRKSHTERAAELARGERSLAVRKKQLAGIEPVLEVSAPLLAAPAGAAPPRAGADSTEMALRARLEIVEAGRRKLKPLHSEYRRYLEEKERIERTLAGLPLLAFPPVPGRGPGLIRQPNPARAQKDLEVQTLEEQVAGLHGEVERIKADLEDAEAKTAGRSALYSTLEFLKADMRVKEDVSKKAEEEQKRTRDLYEKVVSSDPFEVLFLAMPPRRATEPDPLTLFAISVLVGGGLGLAAASLREYGRTSYRTLEDAARSLPVPVLGAVAWVRTEVERRRSRRRRIAATFASSTAALLLMAVFVAYSATPTSLPKPVFKFLDSIHRALR